MTLEPHENVSSIVLAYFSNIDLYYIWWIGGTTSSLWQWIRYSNILDDSFKAMSNVQFFKRFNPTLFIRYAWLSIYRLPSWPPNGWTSYFFSIISTTKIERKRGRTKKSFILLFIFISINVYSHFGKQYLSVIQWALGGLVCFRMCVSFQYFFFFFGLFVSLSDSVCVWMSIVDIRNKNQMKTCPIDVYSKE